MIFSKTSPVERKQYMDQILYEVSDRVAVITLNRPEVANAQTMELLDDLDAPWPRPPADAEARATVCRGTAKTSPPGIDLKAPGPHRPAPKAPLGAINA